MSDQKYYSLDRILATKSTINILLGQRANGKSYAVKREAVKEAFLGMGNLIYLRRYQMELKQSDVAAYFWDCPVKEITGGKYDEIRLYQGRIYLVNSGEDEAIKKGQEIGRTAALVGATHLKSVIERGKYRNIIYEEFCTDSGYLPSEPDKLQQFTATVFGVQNVGRVYLIGNTVSRVNPYFSAWGLVNLRKMQPGDLDLYQFTNEDGSTVTLAVEFCSSINVPSGMFFGNVAKNITTGVWETEAQPQIPKEFEPFKVLYKVGLKHTDFYFSLKVLKNKLGEFLLLCAPSDPEEFEKTIRRISDLIDGRYMTSKKLLPLTGGDRLALDLYQRGKLVFANNLTGADFKAIMKERGGL